MPMSRYFGRCIRADGWEDEGLINGKVYEIVADSNNRHALGLVSVLGQDGQAVLCTGVSFTRFERVGDSAEPVQKTDAVNNPPHYGGVDNPYETIKVIEAWELNFNTGNAVKYISRAGKKSADLVEDLKKAIWYLNREVENLSK